MSFDIVTAVALGTGHRAHYNTLQRICEGGGSSRQRCVEIYLTGVLSFAFLTPEDWSDRLSRNVGTELPPPAAQWPRTAQFSYTSRRTPGSKHTLLSGRCGEQVHPKHP